MEKEEGVRKCCVFFVVGSSQEVISLLTVFLITLSQADKCVVVCPWMPVYVALCSVSAKTQVAFLCNIKQPKVNKPTVRPADFVI